MKACSFLPFNVTTITFLSNCYNRMFTSIKSFQCEEFLTIDWQSLQVGVGGSVVEYFRKITDIYGY